MKIIYQYLIIIFCLGVSSCGGDDKRPSASKKITYDFCDERYQDFYSRYMRKAKIDYLIVTSKNIRKKFEFEQMPDNVLARVNVKRVNPLEQKNLTINNLANKEEILAYYNRAEEKFRPCNAIYEENHFFCIEDIKSPKWSQIYFYVPAESIKFEHINQVISMSCSEVNNEKNCSIYNHLNAPFNASLSIHFTNPQNFFYIMPYVEQHFYEITGEHAWQTLPKHN